MNREMASVGLAAAPDQDRRVGHREASEVLTEASGRGRRVGRREAQGRDRRVGRRDLDRPSEA